MPASETSGTDEERTLAAPRFPYDTPEPSAKGSPVGSPLLGAVMMRRAVWYRSRVRPRTSDHDPMCARPGRGNVVAHDGGMRTDQAAPPRRVRALAPPRGTDQATDRNGCDSASRTRPRALGQWYGRLQDRIGSCRALHTDPGADAAQHLTVRMAARRPREYCDPREGMAPRDQMGPPGAHEYVRKTSDG